MPLFVFSRNEASVWKSQQNNSSTVRSREASRKPLCIFPEDLPMSAFCTHDTYLLGTGAGLGNASAVPPGQPKCTLCPQPLTKDDGPHVGCLGYAVGLSSLQQFSQTWPELILLQIQPPVSPGLDLPLLSRGSGPRVTFPSSPEALSIHPPPEPLFQTMQVAKWSF